MENSRNKKPTKFEIVHCSGSHDEIADICSICPDKRHTSVQHLRAVHAIPPSLSSRLGYRIAHRGTSACVHVTLILFNKDPKVQE